MTASTNTLKKFCERELAGNSHSNPTSKISAITRGVLSFLNLGNRLDEETILKTVKGVWDEYVVKYDWPYVDGAIEEWLEDQAWKMAEMGIKALVAKFSELDQTKGDDGPFTAAAPE